MTLAANLAALARRIVGTAANNLVALDGAGKLPAVDGSRLTNSTGVKKRVSSGLLTPSLGGLLTWGHGLGVTPSRTWASLICQTAEFGYSVGDEIVVFFTSTSGVNAGFGVQTKADATNVLARIGSNHMGYSAQFDNGFPFAPDVTKWKVKLWAEL